MPPYRRLTAAPPAESEPPTDPQDPGAIAATQRDALGGEGQVLRHLRMAARFRAAHGPGFLVAIPSSADAYWVAPEAHGSFLRELFTGESPEALARATQDVARALDGAGPARIVLVVVTNDLFAVCLYATDAPPPAPLPPLRRVNAA